MFIPLSVVLYQRRRVVDNMWVVLNDIRYIFNRSLLLLH